MKAPRPSSAGTSGGALARRAAAVVLAPVLALVLALVLAAPLLATVWTRASIRTRIAKGGRVTLEDASYAGRDWNAALTALDVRQASDRSAGAGMVTTTWTFHYTNTDREPHYVALNIACLDAGGRERFRFKATATLLADRRAEATVDVGVKMREADWNTTSVVKIVADFLSGPEG